MKFEELRKEIEANTFLDYSPCNYELTGRVSRKHQSDQLIALCRVSFSTNKPSDKKVEVLARTYRIAEFYEHCDLLASCDREGDKVTMYVWLDCQMRECYVNKGGAISKDRQPMLDVDKFIKQFYNCNVAINDYMKGLLL